MLDPEVGIPIGGGWTALIEAKSNVRDTTVVSLQTHNVVKAGNSSGAVSNLHGGRVQETTQKA